MISRPETNIISSFDKTQLFIYRNSASLIESLRGFTKPFPNHIGDMLDSSNANGRIFFQLRPTKFVLDDTLTADEKAEKRREHEKADQKTQELLIDQANAVLNNILVIESFNEKFASWEPLFTAENIKNTKDNIIDYFFTPIEMSKEWQAFWAEQSALIKQEDQISVRDCIAGSVTFKIQSNWTTFQLKHYYNGVFPISNSIDTMKLKLIALDVISHNISKPITKIIEIKKDTVKTAFENQLTLENDEKGRHIESPLRVKLDTFITGHSYKKEEKKKIHLKSEKDVLKELSDSIKSMRERADYKSLPPDLAEATLQDVIAKNLIAGQAEQKYSSNDKTAKNAKIVLEKIVEAVLDDINAHFQDLLKNKMDKNTFPHCFLTTVEAARPYLTKKQRKDYVDLLKHSETVHIANKHRSLKKPEELMLSLSKTADAALRRNGSGTGLSSRVNRMMQPTSPLQHLHIDEVNNLLAPQNTSSQLSSQGMMLKEFTPSKNGRDLKFTTSQKHISRTSSESSNTSEGKVTRSSSGNTDSHESKVTRSSSGNSESSEPSVASSWSTLHASGRHRSLTAVDDGSPFLSRTIQRKNGFNQ